MKTLLIHRHAKSSWDHPGMSDHDRPLNSRGLKDAPEMGKRLREKGEKPDLIVSSTAARAIGTARMVAKEIGFPQEKIKTDRHIYMAGVNTLLDVINQFDDSLHYIFIFGHNPGFTDLAEYLTSEYLGNIPTSGQVKVSFAVDNWELISQGMGHLEWFDYPKNDY